MVMPSCSYFPFLSAFLTLLSLPLTLRHGESMSVVSTKYSPKLFGKFHPLHQVENPDAVQALPPLCHHKQPKAMSLKFSE